MSTVYLMKYALTTGVIPLQLTGEQTENLSREGHVFCKPETYGYKSTFFAKDIALNLKDAENMFEEIRIKKLKSLDKQIKKYSMAEMKVIS